MAFDVIPTADLRLDNNKLFSDIQTKIASENQISTNISLNQEQAGLVNIKGTIDASTKKSALLYAPVSINNSPYARASSSPQIEQGGGENPLSGLFSAPSTLIVVAGLGVALLLLTGAAKPSTKTYNTRVDAKVPASSFLG